MHLVLKSLFATLVLSSAALAQTTAPATTPLALPAGNSANAPVPPPPAVTAKQYVLVDYQTGRVLAEQGGDERVPPASITKVMTSYVVAAERKAGKIKDGDLVTISENAWRHGGAVTDGSTSFLELNSQVPLGDLLKGMIIQSGNDASIAIAEHVAGSESTFAALMNQYAEKLGLKNSHFVNAHGLYDPEHYMSAHDIAELSRALIREFPEEYAHYSLKDYTWNEHTQRNRNILLWRDPSVDGIKTGHTSSAGYCLATSAKRAGMRLVSVVFGTASMKAREDASAALLNYGFTFYETVKVKGRGETVLTPRLYKGAEDHVAIAPRGDVYVTVGRGDAALVKTGATAREPIVAPVAMNQALGELVVSVGADAVARVPLFPVKVVPEGGWWTRMVDGVALMWR